MRGLPLELFSPALGIALALSLAAHAATYLLSPVLPLHLHALGGSTAQAGMLFSALSLVAVVLRPLAGGWVDRYGIRRVLVPGALVIVAVSLAMRGARDPWMVIALTAGLGLGFGLASMAASVLAAQGPARRRGQALSIYYLASPLALAGSAPAAVWLAGRWGIGANLAVVTAMGLLLLALATTRWTAGRPAGSRPGRRLVSRGALPLSAVLVVSTMGQSALYAFVPLHAQAHGQAGQLGWFFGLYATTLMLLRLLLGGLGGGTGPRSLVPALAALAAGLAVLAPAPRPATLAAAALLLGAGSAVLYPTLVALVVARVPEAERGLAMGTVSGAWDLGIVVGSLLLGLVAEQAGHGAAFLAAAALVAAALGGLVRLEGARAVARPLPAR